MANSFSFRPDYQNKHAQSLINSVDDSKRIRELSELKELLDKKREKDSRDREEANIKELAKLKRELALDTIREEKGELQAAIEGIKQDFDLSKTLVSAASSLKSTLSSQLDSTINSYMSNYQAMVASLANSGKEWNKIADNLDNALSGTRFVRQEEVYNRLTELVKAGISDNVEQRAFLETISKDLNLLLNTQDGQLARLIRMQDVSIAENRLATQQSLREFLNQTYQTSEYIRDAYSSVASSIADLQMLTTTKEASSIESALQTWLGAYYSEGVSGTTITSLANAINALGTGDISNIDSNISRLLMMGAAKSNLSYGNLLINGLNANDVSNLMSGITNYAQSITGNNVTRAQWANLFGLSITDLEALKNFELKGKTSVSSNINDLFGEYSDFLPTTVGLKNSFANLMFSTATSIAENAGLYGTYFATDILEKSGIGGMLKDLGTTYKSKTLQTAGIAIENAKLIPYLGGLLTSLFADNGISNLFTRDGISGTYAALGGVEAGKNVGSTVAVSTSLSDNLNNTKGQLPTEAAGDEPTSDDNIKQVADTTSMIYDALAGDVGNSIRDILIEIRDSISSSSTGL